MLLGMICVGAMFGGYEYLSKNQRFIADFKRDHPMVCLGVVFVGGYLLISMLGSVMVFMFGVLLPISGKVNPNYSVLLCLKTKRGVISYFIVSKNALSKCR